MIGTVAAAVMAAHFFYLQRLEGFVLFWVWDEERGEMRERGERKEKNRKEDLICECWNCMLFS